MYIFSLRDDLIRENQKDLDTYLESKKYHLELSDLVLLQVDIINYDFTGVPPFTKDVKKKLKLQVIEVYTLTGDDFPTDDLVNPKVTSRLVE